MNKEMRHVGKAIAALFLMLILLPTRITLGLAECSVGVAVASVSLAPALLTVVVVCAVWWMLRPNVSAGTLLLSTVVPSNTDDKGTMMENVMCEPVQQTRFEREMDGVRYNLIAMGDSCRGMLGDAMVALLNSDSSLAESVLARDADVDDFEVAIESKTLHLLALQGVFGSNRRFVCMALKASTDIERIGDHCVNIAKTARWLNREGTGYLPLVDVKRLADIATTMLKEAIDAFVYHDVDKAQDVISRDDEADVLYHEFQRELRAVLVSGEGGDRAVTASHLLFVAHYLERICDHCVGIAEWVLFVETGQKTVAGTTVAS